eukprot:TRINITY_DN8689_c0_g1_i2.p1 TRINITY_DN8689_c0_g1~~TRINITY_DN8689_c0_g1_i2.p1  ORF type:complete len:218 (+),score=34.41 TRINITY_DN8689_c0_g1_i2:94-747(+)
MFLAHRRFEIEEAHADQEELDRRRASEDLEAWKRRRASREDPKLFISRFGYDPQEDEAEEEARPLLQVTVPGHHEEDGHTLYILDCSIICQGLPYTDKDPRLLWRCSRRLCDLRDGIYSFVKSTLGEVYTVRFRETPFAKRGGLPGTTDRLKAWMTTLAHCMNNDVLFDASALATILRLLEAPIPDEQLCKFRPNEAFLTQVGERLTRAVQLTPWTA